MNKKQWYGLGIWFFVVGSMMCMVTMAEIGAPSNPIVECDVFYVLERLVYKLVGTSCMVASFACWLCGWLEKEGAR